jgi:hypothetical protein
MERNGLQSLADKMEASAFRTWIAKEKPEEALRFA